MAAMLRAALSNFVAMHYRCMMRDSKLPSIKWLEWAAKKGRALW